MTVTVVAVWLAGALATAAAAELALTVPWRRWWAGGPGVVRERAGRRRRAAELAAGAAPAARALADALGGGRSLTGAVAAAAQTVPGAAGRELRTAARAVAAGVPVDDALERLRARAAAPAWDTLVAAIGLQRAAGGDLAALLRELAGALEAGERARAEARTATAQARFTVRLVAGLPVTGAALGELAAPGTLAGLLGHGPARLCLAGAAALQLAALVAVRRITRVPA